MRNEPEVRAVRLESPCNSPAQEADIFKFVAYEDAKTSLAKSLRERMTFAERRLWTRSRARRNNGLLWFRQEPFGPYIVDFYCPTARLVVELDGAAHGLRLTKDQERQAWIEEQGATVLRFSNTAVVNDLSKVIFLIDERCHGHFEAE